MKKSLTPKQQEFYAYLSAFVVSHHRQPTYREMMEAMKWTSLNSPRTYLDNLSEKGWIEISQAEKNFRTWKFAGTRLVLENS